MKRVFLSIVYFLPVFLFAQFNYPATRKVDTTTNYHGTIVADPYRWLEDDRSEETKQWAGALENYTLKNNQGKTELIVDMDISGQYKDYFLKTWPKALDKVKELAEKN